MKAWHIQGDFGLDNLASVELDRPEPASGQVLVRMRAASLNYRDYMTVEGTYNPRQPLPLIPCSDGCGLVEAVGEGVTEWEVGDRVIPIFAQRWLSGEPTKSKLRSTLGGPLDGTLAEYAVFDAEALVRAPEHLSDAEAATLPCAALTAWSAMVEQGEVTAGSTVLVQGTGGVSIFGLLLGKMLGATVVVTSSSDEKLERARDLGADYTLNYKETPEWGRPIAKMVGGDGVDHVIEVGGAGTLEQSLRAVRIGGHISMIGVLAGAAQKINVVRILMQNVRVQGILVGHREGFERMNRAISAHQLHPVISDRFPFEEVPEAFRHMEQGRHFGKIVIEF